MLGVIDIRTGDPLVAGLAELALFSVLFTDGMRVGVADLRSAWRLPGRALLLGLPLTLVITAAAAHYVAGLPWLCLLYTSDAADDLTRVDGGGWRIIKAKKK